MNVRLSKSIGLDWTEKVIEKIICGSQDLTIQTLSSVLVSTS